MRRVESGSLGDQGDEGRDKDSSEMDPVMKRTKFIKGVLDRMSDEELNRFEFFSRSHLPRSRVRDLMAEVFGPQCQISEEMVIIVAGLTKQFIGELTDTAADVMKEEHCHSSVQVSHIQEAYRRMQLEGKVVRLADQSYYFRVPPSYSLEDDFSDPFDTYEEKVAENQADCPPASAPETTALPEAEPPATKAGSEQQAPMDWESQLDEEQASEADESK